MIRHTRAIETDAAAGFFLRHALVLDQDLEGFGELHRVQVGALDVLDQRHFDHLAVGGVENHGREPRRAPRAATRASGARR